MTPVRAWILVALLPLSACGGRAATPDETPPALPTVSGDIVTIPPGSSMLQQLKRAPVAVRALPVDEVVAAGKIEANPNRISKIFLPVAGRVVDVPVKSGDSVQKGQPLLTLASPDADAAISTFLAAEAGVSQAQAGLGKAQADDERAADLFAHNAIARKEVLTADNALAQAKAALDQAQASREQAVRRLAVLGLTPGSFDQRVVVRAPLTGKVLELSIVPGEYRSDTSAAVMTIADLASVLVTAQVPESDIRFVKVGERVEITLVAYPGETFEGRVSRIADTVDPQTRTVKVQAELENRGERFRPEMYGSIRHIASLADTPVVPAGAVAQADGRSIVFVEVAPGRFERRRVEIGKPAGDVVPVTRGLRAGDTVVVDGVMLLKGLVRS
jgi:cobalt-zinc-cadmium efflux system membrane fusion protein